MKNFLALLLFFWTLAITSTWSANERILIPSVFNQRQKLGRFASFRKVGRRNWKTVMHLKHLLEMDCLKELCSKHGKPGQNFYDATRPMSPPTYDRNQFREDPQKSRGYFSDDRMISGLPTVYFINKPVNAPVQDSNILDQNKSTKSIQEEELINQSTEKNLQGKYFKALQEEGDHTTEGNPGVDNPEVLKTDDLPKTEHTTHETTSDELSNQTISTTTSDLFRHPNRPSQIKQYEVQEIVNEKSTDSFELDEKRIFHKPNSEGQMGKKPGVESHRDVGDSKLKTTLKALLSPFLKNEVIKQIPHPTNVSHRNISGHRSRDFDGDMPQPARKEEPKHPNVASPHPSQGRGEKAAEETTVQFESNVAFSNFSKYNFRSDGLNGTEAFKSITEKSSRVSYTPDVYIPYKKVNQTVQKSRQKALDVDTSEPLDGLESLYSPAYATTAKQEFNDYGFIPSERTTKKSTDHRVPDSGKASFVKSSEIQTTARVISQGSREFITTRTDELAGLSFVGAGPGFPGDPSATDKHLEVFESFSGATVKKAELTTATFEEFTDRPLLFDLFPEVRKDPDAKNSRKMHFGHEPRKTTSPNQNPEESSQRRSDILIDDKIDYTDYDSNLSSPNYLEKLRENNFLPFLNPRQNFTSDSIIPLIPIVVNDLREGKIPPEDIPILSETFGKHWSTVLALSNNTNLDMLPLMKMKDEKDLENVMESLRSESVEGTTTVKADGTSNKNFYDLYDYLDKDLYKDLYKDLLEIQEGKKPVLNYGGEDESVSD